MKTSQDLVREALQAIIKGDYEERDGLIQEAHKAVKREEYEYKEAKIKAEAKILTIDFYVKADGTVIQTSKIYAATH